MGSESTRAPSDDEKSDAEWSLDMMLTHAESENGQDLFTALQSACDTPGDVGRRRSGVKLLDLILSNLDKTMKEDTNILTEQGAKPELIAQLTSLREPLKDFAHSVILDMARLQDVLTFHKTSIAKMESMRR